MFTLLIGAALSGVLISAIPIGIALAQKRRKGWKAVVAIFVVVNCLSETVRYASSFGTAREVPSNLLLALFDATFPTSILLNLLFIFGTVGLMRRDEQPNDVSTNENKPPA